MPSKSLVTLFALVGFSSATVHADNPAYASEAALTKAVEFAPGIISTKAHFEINTVFNKAGDNVLFARCADDFTRCTMMQSEFKQGAWQPAKNYSFQVAISRQILITVPTNSTFILFPIDLLTVAMKKLAA